MYVGLYVADERLLRPHHNNGSKIIDTWRSRWQLCATIMMSPYGIKGCDHGAAADYNVFRGVGVLFVYSRREPDCAKAGYQGRLLDYHNTRGGRGRRWRRGRGEWKKKITRLFTSLMLFGAWEKVLIPWCRSNVPPPGEKQKKKVAKVLYLCWWSCGWPLRYDEWCHIGWWSRSHPDGKNVYSRSKR